MIDNSSILFSILMIAFVLFKAIKLDRTRAWFREEDGPGRPDVRRPAYGRDKPGARGTGQM